MLLHLVRVDLGVKAIKGYSAFSKAPALLKPRHQIVYIQDTRWGEVLPLLHRCSRCNLQPQLIGPQDTPWRDVLPLCREAVGVFYSSSRMGHPKLIVGTSYSSAEMQSLYSTAPVNWAIGHSLGESYPIAEMQTVFSTAPTDWTTGHSLRERLTPLQRCNQCILQPQLIGP